MALTWTGVRARSPSGGAAFRHLAAAFRRSPWTGSATRAPALRTLALGAALLVSAAPPPIVAQGLPPFTPINPATSSRSGLYFQPYQDPRSGWVKAVRLEYASMIELNLRPDTGYLLDAEVMRLSLAGRRDLGRRAYVTADVVLGGAYDGFLDGFLNWYHGLLGIPFPEREERPANRYDFAIVPEGGPDFRGRKRGLFLEDARLGVGWRHGGGLQSHLTVTLPTSTGPAGFGRGTVSVGLINTARTPLWSGALFEGSLGVGYTPRRGPFAAHQRATFVSASSGVRGRLWGGQYLYANLFYHSPYYERLGLRALEGADLALSFGAIFRTAGGGEWRLGLSEDLFPSGPGVDLVLQVGRTF